VDARSAHEQAGNVRLVDVREDFEWRGGHIDGAEHKPLADIVGSVDDFRDGKKIVTLCTVGARSAEAAAFLASNGVDAENLDGGLVGWLDAGFPLVDSSGNPGRLVH
jgi:rhodanese-related sulfurtransferase